MSRQHSWGQRALPRQTGPATMKQVGTGAGVSTASVLDETFSAISPVNQKTLVKTHRAGKIPSKTLCRFLLSAFFPAVLALSSRAGVALKLQYNNIPGINVSDLTNNAAFPNTPDTFDVLTSGLAVPMNIANDYGSWVRGFLEAPQSGERGEV